MKLACIFGFHKWNKYSQKVSLVWRDKPHSSGANIDIDVRMCKECFKKQKKEWNPWADLRWENFAQYSKEEKRDMSLKKILGKDV